MAGHRPFAGLTERLPSASRARMEVRKVELRDAMPLHELRQARAMTQKAVGIALDVQQPAVAKLERRTDMYVSNLRSLIKAMGGQLDIIARFPQGSVVITNFTDVGEDRIDADQAPGRKSEPHEKIKRASSQSGEDSPVIEMVKSDFA